MSVQNKEFGLDVTMRNYVAVCGVGGLHMLHSVLNTNETVTSRVWQVGLLSSHFSFDQTSTLLLKFASLCFGSMH